MELSIEDLTGRLGLDAVTSFLEKYAEQSNSVYWLSSPDFSYIKYISPAYEIIWDRPRQDLINNPEIWIEHLHPDDVLNYHPIHHMREEVEKLGGEARYEENYRILRPNGEIRWIVDRGFPIMAKDGSCLGVTGVAVDVTGEREAEKLELERENAQKLAQHNRAVAGTIAHDLRTPLASIGLCARNVSNYLPPLIDAYTCATQNNLDIPKLDIKEFQSMPCI